MPYSDYLKRRALFFHAKGLSPPAIADALAEEGLVATRQGLAKFIRCFKETGSIKRCPGSGRPSKVTPEVKAVVEAQMREDDETRAVQLCALLRSKGYNISQSTILRSRSSLGWTFRGSAYCHMIRQVNKAKRLEWAQQYAHEATMGFLDVVYTDETSIQLEAHRRFCCRKRGEPPRHKPRYELVVYAHARIVQCILYIIIETERNGERRFNATVRTVAVPFLSTFSETKRNGIKRYWKRFFDAYCSRSGTYIHTCTCVCIYMYQT